MYTGHHDKATCQTATILRSTCLCMMSWIQEAEFFKLGVELGLFY